MSYIFPFVEGDVFGHVVWDENINICFSFVVMYSVNDMYAGVLPFFGVLITDEVGCVSLKYMSFDLGRNNAIVSGWYPKGWFHNSNICLRFTVFDVSKESTLLLYVAILFSVPGLGQGEFLLYIDAK